MKLPALPIMVLAHNEEPRIVACLNSIFAAENGATFEVYVLANGCTDRTEDVVRDFARGRPEVHLLSIPLADKCHAWNVFIHEVVPNRCPGRDVYFFMSGDSRVVEGSFGAMVRGLREHPHTHAASAVPATGRNREFDRSRILTEHGLVANLYSLRGTFVERLARRAVRLPLNLEGDDGLLGALIKWDLAPERNELDHARVVPCAEAAFAFTSLSPLRPADWARYWRRAIRYSRRCYEFELLGKRLRALGLAGLPADVTELYSKAVRLRFRRHGLHTIPSVVAWCQIQRIGHGRREAK